jgi:hypothetical protein
MRSQKHSALVLALFTCAVALLTAAPAPAQDLASAQAALARYDLADPRTYEALETLRRVADANGPEAPTARAVRAYAGVDLLVASSILEDQAAFGRLAAALGASDRETMGSLLEQQLSRTPSGALAVAANEARSTLGALLGRSARRTVRSDAIVLLTAPADEAALRARLHDRFDPVTDRDFGRDGAQADEARRIAAAIRAARAAVRAAEAGDPLLLLLRPRLEGARERLTRLVLEAPETRDHDVVVRVAAGSLAVGFVPRARVDGDGRVVLLGGTPRLPETASIELPTDLPPIVRPIDGLAQHAVVTGTPAGQRVVLRLEGEVPAHLVARVVRSLEGTPLAIGAIETAEGRLAVTWAREGTLGEDVARVLLRPGGYALERHGGRRVEIPRIRVDGRFRFDREGLTRELARVSGARAVSASSPTPAEELFATAWLARDGDRATIVLP